MVRSAYSSGKPAIGVGAGNGPAYIHRSADVGHALDCILRSKTFDNGTVCASEQSIIVEKGQEQQVRQLGAQKGFYFMNTQEAGQLAKLLFRPSGALNPEIVGRSALELAEKAGLKTIADIGFNVFNSHTAAALEQDGVSQTVLSPELTATQISNIKTNLPTGFFAYGRLPLMLTKNCPVKTKNGCGGCKKDRTITDRLGKKFPVACQNGFSVVYNSVPIWLADKKSGFAKCDFMYLYFTFESPKEIKQVITAYQNGDTAKTEYSRGLYFRGVK